MQSRLLRSFFTSSGPRYVTIAVPEAESSGPPAAVITLIGSRRMHKRITAVPLLRRSHMTCGPASR